MLSRISANACVAALLLMIAYPSLFPTHFEGISAMTEVAARLPRPVFLNSGVTQPLVAEFVLASRPLMVGLVRLFASVTGSIETGFCALITVSFGIFIAASCAVARRLTSLPWLLLLLGFASFPGLTSLGYSLNDNIVAGAFAMSALAVVTYAPRTAGCCVSGILLGIATCVRPDSLLISPAIALMAWQEELTWREILIRAVCGIAGFLAVLLALPLVSGISALDMMSYAWFFAKEVPAASHTVAALNATDAVNAPSPMPAVHSASSTVGGLLTKIIIAGDRTLLFVGPSGIMLTAIATIIAVKNKFRIHRLYFKFISVRRFLLIYAYPAAIFVFAFRYAIVIRYFYLFSAPFISAMAAYAIDWLIRLFKQGGATKITCASLIASVSIAMPPLLPRAPGGPEVFAGVLWVPDVWLRYGNGVRAGIAGLTSQLAPNIGDETTIIANGWDEASFSLLAALRAGNAPTLGDLCPSTVAHFIAPDKATVMLVSSFDPWNQTLLPYRLSSAAQIDAAATCYPKPPTRLITTFHSTGVQNRVPANGGLSASDTAGSIRPFVFPDQLPLLHFGSMALEPAQWTQIGGAAQANLRGANSKEILSTIQSRLGSRLDVPLAARQR